MTETISVKLCSHPNCHKTNLGAEILIFDLLTARGPNFNLLNYGAQWVGVDKIMLGDALVLYTEEPKSNG